MHHRHHVILDAVAIALAFAADDHFGADGVGVTGAEGVGAVGLLERATDAVDRHLPQLGGDRLVDLGIVDAFHVGLEVGADLEAALFAAIALQPDAASAVAAEARLPGVAVLVSSAEGLA